MSAAKVTGKSAGGLGLGLLSAVTTGESGTMRDALGDVVTSRPKFLLPIPENCVVWGNRAVAPFPKNFFLQRITLTPQVGCRVCGEIDVQG